MRKLTAKTKFEIAPEGHAVIFAKRKGEDKFVPAFTCHASCIPVIQAAGTIFVDNVILRAA